MGLRLCDLLRREATGRQLPLAPLLSEHFERLADRIVDLLALVYRAVANIAVLLGRGRRVLAWRALARADRHCGLRHRILRWGRTAGHHTVGVVSVVVVTCGLGQLSPAAGQRSREPAGQLLCQLMELMAKQLRSESIEK